MSLFRPSQTPTNYWKSDKIMTGKKSTQRHFDMLSTAFGSTINKLIEQKDIIEIMLNPDGKLWTESLLKGKFFTGETMEETQAENIIKLVAASIHGIVNAENPELSCELPGSGARFQGWLPPVVSAPTFDIRKRAVQIFTFDDYLATKSITPKQIKTLKQAIADKKNILVAGGTGSGKTTFANALLHELTGSPDRVVILEDLPELQIAVEDYVTLRTSPTKTMRDLVKGVLRMRPDRIIIGEVRDGAALELLKAWNTGHPGGICTIHANSAQSTLTRLEDLIQEVVSIVPQRLIIEAIDVIVFMRRDKQGKHIVDTIHSYGHGDEQMLTDLS